MLLQERIAGAALLSVGLLIDDVARLRKIFQIFGSTHGRIMQMISTGVV